MTSKKDDIEINTVKDYKNSIAASNYRGWHTKENTNFWPNRDLMNNNIDSVSDSLFSQYGPPNPIFSNTSKIMTMGSCFAMRIREWMESFQKTSDTVFVPEGLNNSFAVRQFIDWALTGNRSSDAYWYDQDQDKNIFKWESAEEQKTVREKFINYDGFIITFGLSEVWRDKQTKGVFWRGVPNELFDPERHECVVSTVEENVQNMIQIIQLIQTHCGNKPIIFTLSPVPLNASFQNRPCIVSDCVSKSILRVAIEEIQRQEFTNLYYWPSFELVKWVPTHADVKGFGEEDGLDSRHVSNWAVSTIIKNFVKKFFI